jgi:hypothetical protein
MNEEKQSEERLTNLIATGWLVRRFEPEGEKLRRDKKVKKKQKKYPRRRPRKSLPRSFSRRGSGYRRGRWWLQIGRHGLKKRLLHVELPSRTGEG